MCNGIKSNGQPCGRRVEGYCFQHKDQEVVEVEVVETVEPVEAVVEDVSEIELINEETKVSETKYIKDTEMVCDQIVENVVIETDMVTVEAVEMSPVKRSAFFNELFSKKNEIRRKNIKNLNDVMGSRVLSERFDRNKLAFILNNEEKIMKDIERPDARNLPILEKYYDASKKSRNGTNIGDIDVKYAQTHSKTMFGREQAVGSVSGQSMLREVRHTIFDGYYTDLDIDNAHPVITLWLCDNLGINCGSLRYYVKNRELVFKDVMEANNEMTRDMCKTLFLSINYGGSQKYNAIENKTAFMVQYRNEFKKIAESLCKHFDSFYKTTKELRIKDGKKYNFNGATVSHICQFIENQILMHMTSIAIDKFGEEPLLNSILCFDGIMIPSDEYDDSIREEMSSYFKSMGINLAFSTKAFKPIDLTSYGYDADEEYHHINRADQELDNIINGEKDTNVTTTGVLKPIFDKSVKSCMFDCQAMMETVQTRSNVYKYVINNFAWIASGGNYTLVSKNFDTFDNVAHIVIKCVSSLNRIKFDIGEDESLCLVQILNSPKICKAITYSNIDFLPFGALEHVKPSPNVFNKFTGFVNKYQSDFKIDMSKIERFLDLLKYGWADGNQTYYEFILKWFAWILQHPLHKTAVGLVIIGGEGCGKNTVLNHFSNHVLGRAHTLEVDSLTPLTQRFNGSLEAKLLTVLNEAVKISNSETASKDQEALKSLITSETLTIEPKGLGTYTIRDCNNYVCLSNNEYVVKASKEMRRFSIFKASDRYIGNYDFFNKLNNDFVNEDAGIHLYHYLMDIELDLKDGNLQKQIPRTEIKDDIRENILTKVSMFLKDLVTDEKEPDGNIEKCRFTGEYLFNLYKHWCERTNNPFNMTQRKFSVDLVKLIGGAKVIRQGKQLKRVYEINRTTVKDACLKAFDINVFKDIEADEDDSAQLPIEDLDEDDY